MGSVGAIKIGGGRSNMPSESAIKGSRADVEAEVDKFTPEQFLGDNFTRLWDGTGQGFADAMDSTAPAQLILAGHEFNAIGDVMFMPPDSSGWVMAVKEYQSTDTMGGEYPIFRVTAMGRMTASGRIKTSIKKTGSMKSGLI